MDQRANAEAVVDVRIDVSADFLTGSASGLDVRQGQIHLTPIAAPGSLEMEDVHGRACALTDAQGLVNRFKQTVAFVAHMRVVAPAIFTRHFGEFENLLFGRIDGGWIDE